MKSALCATLLWRANPFHRFSQPLSTATGLCVRNRFNARELELQALVANPLELTSLTFYKFFKEHFGETESLRDRAYNAIHDIGARGTLLIAKEGVNAQFAVPRVKLDDFQSVVRNIDPSFADMTFNIGESKIYCDSKQLPFRKLVVRTKHQVLSDGFAESATPASNEGVSIRDFDWTDAGPEVTGAEWHWEISSSCTDKAPPILLDCRNQYEYRLGTFKGAIPLQTKKFSESWSQLDNMLKDVPKDTRVLTFCTGGIRCIKVNAYLKQRLGLTNIGRLKQGIIGYEQWLRAHSLAPESPLESQFVGTNFLFDRRQATHMHIGDSTAQQDQNTAVMTMTQKDR